MSDHIHVIGAVSGLKHLFFQDTEEVEKLSDGLTGTIGVRNFG